MESKGLWNQRGRGIEVVGESKGTWNQRGLGIKGDGDAELNGIHNEGDRGCEVYNYGRKSKVLSYTKEYTQPFEKCWFWLIIGSLLII
jgi:hypothetical protein